MTWRLAEPYSGDVPKGFVQITDQPGLEGFPFYLNTNGHWAFEVRREQARSVLRMLNASPLPDSEPDSGTGQRS